MKVFFRILLLVLLATATSPASVWASEFTGITFGLVSMSWNTQLAPAVAGRAGFFKDEGLEVRSVTIPSGGPIMMALLTSGQADMVLTSLVAVLHAIAGGAPAIIVGGLIDKPQYALVGAKGLKSLGELKGKVVGSTGAGSFSEFAVVESLQRKGLLRDRDYTLIPAGGTAVRMAALAANRIQAAPLSPGERVQMEKKGFPILLEIGKTLPEFPFTSVAATKKFAASNPGKVAAILRALSRAMRFIRENKDRAVELGKMHGLPGEPEMQRRALDYYAEDFDVRLKKENVDALLNVLGLKGGPDAFFDDSYLRRAEIAR